MAVGGLATGVDVALAWAYVGLRVVHSLVAGANQPRHDPVLSFCRFDYCPVRADHPRASYLCDIGFDNDGVPRNVPIRPRN